MRCTGCGFESPAGKKFCSECGTGLACRCPQCDAENTQAAKFRGECGVSLKAPAGNPVSETASLQQRDVVGERRCAGGHRLARWALLFILGLSIVLMRAG
jgi:hypothetical protein